MVFPAYPFILRFQVLYLRYRLCDYRALWYTGGRVRGNALATVSNR